MNDSNASSPASGAGGARVGEGGGGDGARPPDHAGKRSLSSFLETDLGWFGFARTPIPAEKIIERAPLPAEHRALIARVVKRTKLWRRERADVARELVAHFADGAEAGASGAELINSFGDEKQAAKLIRRGKKRNRGVVWQAWRRAWQAAACLALLLVGVYLYFGVRMWTASPSINRNYVAELNAAALALPEQDRGWPLVREAILAKETLPTIRDDDGDLVYLDLEKERPGSAHWPLVVSHLQKCEMSLAFLCAAAEKPTLGRRLVLDDDREFMAAVNGIVVPDRPPPPCDNPDLLSVMLPHLGSIRECGRLLAADAVHSATESQGKRVAEDLRAALWLGEQSRNGEYLISSLVGVSILRLAIRSAAEIIDETPGALSDEQWRSVAHAIVRADGGGRIIIPLGSERIMCADLLQRTFSDNGRGNGTVTNDGLKYLASLASPGRMDLILGEASALKGGSALAPIAVAFIADRRSQREMFEGMIGYQESLAASPLWEQPTAAEVESRTDGPLDDRFLRMRFWPVFTMLPALRRFYFTGEAITQERDAALVAIALELFNRRYGRYPAALSDLVPAMLPAVPPDRFTGRPINYVLKDGQPFLYSVGTDLDDDGGTPPPSNAGRTDAPNRVNQWKHPAELERLRQEKPDSIPDGDWILYPPSMTQ